MSMQATRLCSFTPINLNIPLRQPHGHLNCFPGHLRGGVYPCGGKKYGIACSSAGRKGVPTVCASSAGTVRVIIQGRNIEVTDAIREYADQKIAKAVEHFEQSVREVDASMSVRGGDTGTKGDRQHKIEVTVHTLRNGMIRSECVADSMYASIDLVCHKVQRQLRKLKGKAIVKGKWPGRGGEKGGEKIGDVTDPMDDLELESASTVPEIVRTKYHLLTTQTGLEAVEELEKLDHDFYLFRDAKDNDIRIVYKRKERGYGVIIPVDK